MTSPIRPSFSPTPAPAQQPPGVRAAQRAFFDAALGKAAEAAPAARQAQPQAPAVTRAAPVLTRLIPEQPPEKILRPGSFVDIRV